MKRVMEYLSFINVLNFFQSEFSNSLNSGYGITA